VSRARMLDQLERGGKVSGDVPGLRNRLRSTDPAIQTEAQKEFDEVQTRVKSGEKVEIEDYGDPPSRRAPAKESTRISTAEKSELEDSDWLKKRLPDAGDRRKFMDWLKKGHKVGELGAEVEQGQRGTEGHEHIRPGSPEAEAKVSEWESEQGPRKKK
jgi:nucleoid DNA-binding protein